MNKNKGYKKEYYQKNKERIKEHQKKYRQENKEQERERKRKYRQKNKKHIQEQQNRWYQNHKEYQKEYQEKWRQRNREHIRGLSKEWYKNNKEHYYKKLYNITLEEIYGMLIKQDYKCSICKDPLIETKGCVDHNYRTGKVRGILCSRCNTGLGLFRENPEFLNNAILYIGTK